MSNLEHEEQRGGFLGLDSNLGPAKPLTPVDANWLVAQVVSQVLLPAPVHRRRVFELRPLALAAIVVAASATAATVARQKYFHTWFRPARPVIATPQPLALGPHAHMNVAPMSAPSEPVLAAQVPSDPPAPSGSPLAFYLRPRRPLSWLRIDLRQPLI
jgi:hypothetical protein